VLLAAQLSEQGLIERLKQGRDGLQANGQCARAHLQIMTWQIAYETLAWAPVAKLVKRKSSSPLIFCELLHI